jgi:hypothetical protein
MLDLIVDRRDMKTTLGRMLRFMGAKPAVSGCARDGHGGSVDAEPPR